MEHTLWVYPWDVLDDPGAPDEIASLALGRVSLAAAYHSTRSLLPHNPNRKVFSARHAAVYFEPDWPRYVGLRLQPTLATWVAPDSFGSALAGLRTAGQKVHAWIVVLHNSLLGEANPDLVIENAFGDKYTYALCPAHPEVSAYAAAMISDVVQRYPVDAFELEACGYMGVDHLSHHEKAGVQFDGLHRFLISICFCNACRGAMSAEGLDPEAARTAIAAELEAFLQAASPGTDAPEHVDGRLAEILGADPARRLMAARDRVTFGLLDEIATALGEQAADMIITAGSLAYETGAAIGADPLGLAARADALLLPLFGKGDRDARNNVRRLSGAVAGTARIDVGVRAFGPGVTTADDLIRRVRRLTDVGAEGFHYYHYGLCPRPNLSWIAQAAAAAQ